MKFYKILKLTHRQIVNMKTNASKCTCKQSYHIVEDWNFLRYDKYCREHGYLQREKALSLIMLINQAIYY